MPDPITVGMSGQDHYTTAEELLVQHDQALTRAEENPSRTKHGVTVPALPPEEVFILEAALAAAQVHATLALAASTVEAYNDACYAADPASDLGRRPRIPGYGR
ncbi:MAG: hypothetical protein JWO15_3750 [Sphingomonadales bacterium]|nr:hypothetical protein [Sphingomonadales bacterium]